MGEIREFKYRGKRYALDSVGLLRLIQKILTDTNAVFSRGDRTAAALMLNPLLQNIGQPESSSPIPTGTVNRSGSRALTGANSDTIRTWGQTGHPEIMSSTRFHRRSLLV